MRIITTITLALALACLTGCSKQQPPQPVQPVQPADSSTTEPKDPPQVATKPETVQAKPETPTATNRTQPSPPQSTATTPPTEPAKPVASPITPEEFRSFSRKIQLKRNDEVMKVLAERPEFASYGDEQRCTIVVVAASGNLEILDLLLDKYKVSEHLSPALLVSAMRGHLEAARRLLKHGADPNYRLDRSGPSCLHQAVNSARSNLTNVKFLVDAGANVNIVAGQNTPLDIAMMTKKADMQAYLRSKGAKTYKELNP